MKCRRLAVTLIALLALLLSTGRVTGQVPNPQAEAQSEGDMSITANVNSRISYQGVLQEDGTPVSGSRDMVFRVFSDDACTTQIGSGIVRDGVVVTDGLFSVQLDVDHDDFDGQGLWLEVVVGGTVLGCQEILPTPYALSLRPGATIAESSNRVELNRHYQPPSTIVTYHAALYAEADPVFTLPNNIYYGIQALGQDIGVLGKSNSSSGEGVYGHATAASGTNHGVYGRSESPEGAGVSGTAPVTGVMGHALDTNGATYGVHGVNESDYGAGVYGQATANSGSTYGVYGENESTNGIAVYGKATATSGQTEGVRGNSYSPQGVGVIGYNGDTGEGGTGVEGWGGSIGIRGTCWSSTHCRGVFGYAFGEGAYAVHGMHEYGQGYGVYAEATGTDGIGLYAKGGQNGYGVYAEATEADGIGLYAKGGQNGYAAVFDGTAQTQVLQITGGSDLAEPFEIAGAGSLVPGLVVAIDPEHPGQLRVADRPYDRTVVGCISGAKGLNPGLTLEQEGLIDGGLPVALSGRVYCWADASYGSIQPGDLLTSSDTHGHAMKVSAHERAQGAIIGKAMSSLETGQGLILVLVTLQ